MTSGTCIHWIKNIETSLTNEDDEFESLGNIADDVEDDALK